MEKTFTNKKASLEDKIPEFKKTLDVLALLQEKKEQEETLTTHFELTDTLYAKAAIKPVEEVYLWLGVSDEAALLHSVTYLQCRQTQCSHIHLQKRQNC